jgi:hypothetical protein
LALKDELWFRRVDLLIAYLSSLQWGRSEPELSNLSSFQGPAQTHHLGWPRSSVDPTN